jgi:CheY-like chemotaxis protein
MSEDRILVVDDEPQIQRFLKPALRAAGYDVISAEKGAQALKAIAMSAPDVVILDLGLPDIEGKDIIREVRPGRTWRSSCSRPATARARRSRRSTSAPTTMSKSPSPSAN